MKKSGSNLAHHHSDSNVAIPTEQDEHSRVYTDVSIFTANSVTSTFGVDGNGVARSKASFDPSELLFEDSVHQAHLEMTLSG